MYNNIGKRDILIFPKFNNMNIIDEVSIEFIGKHEESIVVKNIKLGE